MLRNVLTPLLAASALVLTASPALAGKEDRARAAIAAAEAKIQAAETLGAAVQMPDQAADARAALALAKEHFAADRDAESIAAATRASSISDGTIGLLQRDKEQALANERVEADIASQQAAAAEQQAAHASARAVVAERSAAASAVDAQAARNALAAEQAADDEGR